MKALLSDYGWQSEYGDMMRKQNEDSNKEFQSIYDRWKREGKKIEEKMEEESKGFGESIRKTYALFFMKRALAQSGMPAPNELAAQISDLWEEHPYINLVHTVHDVFTAGAQISTPNTIRQAIDFIAGDEVRREVPTIQIEPMLWSCLAREAVAASNRKEEIDPGDHNDIAAIANFLPYCDVIFVDNAWNGRLRDNPAASAIKKYHAKVFSSRTIDELMKYLNEIESQAPDYVLKGVAEAYGEIKDENPLDELHLY